MNSTAVIAALRARGELWEHASGLTGLRGDALRLYRALARDIERIAVMDAAEEWRVPPALSFDALARADYFASFPQWLTAASHLSGDDAVLAEVAAAADPARAATQALQSTPTALQPAVCYHVYDALAGSVLDRAHYVTVAGTCWRREESCTPLERGWAFTMREVVCVGSEHEAEALRQRGIGRALALAERLGLDARVARATDPFFAPSMRGRALLQRVKALKHELLLPIGAGRTVAAASFNQHERFFGDAFGITLRDGTPAHTACIAFGIERWLLAFLVAHGVEAAGWPAWPASSDASMERQYA